MTQWGHGNVKQWGHGTMTRLCQQPSVVVNIAASTTKKGDRVRHTAACTCTRGRNSVENERKLPPLSPLAPHLTLTLLVAHVGGVSMLKLNDLRRWQRHLGQDVAVVVIGRALAA